MRHNLLEEKPRYLLKYFLEEYNKIIQIDINKAYKLIKDATYYYSGKIPIPEYVKSLEDQWYNQLNNNFIDYSVYSDKYYFTDIWACWNLYSRKYILSIKKENTIYDYFVKNVNSIVDLGCGIAYSTAMLKQMFPKADVYGTNIAGTAQFNFGYQLSKIYNFQIKSNVEDINKPIDLVFASEYFEHIEDATDNIRNVVKKLNPKCLFLANSFNTKSLGHFLKYKEKTDIKKFNNTELPLYEYYDQKIISKKFNKTLKELGYISPKTKLWNNKPRFWIKNKLVENAGK
tara:strand:- start:920 stop:1780 length:861 start_codon:yes stop_codon:yes gene_type:complete